MKKHFGKIFWGLLLVILDLSISQFDLLPDGIGFALVAVGAGALTDLSPHFRTASFLSWILVVLWLIGFAVHGDAALVLSVVDTAVDCAMMWTLLGGIIQYAHARGRSDLAKQASNRRLAYVILLGGITFLSIVARGSQDLAPPFAVITVVAMLILLVMILHLIHRVRHELAT